MRIQAFILLLLTLGSLASRGQDTIQPRYQSVFGDSCATWYLFFHDWTNYDEEDVGTETRQAIVGDTINVDGTTYNLLRYMPNLSGSREPYLYEDEESLYIRESPDHSKLYFKEHLDLFPEMTFPEVLIMDLDLNVGDTLNTQGWSQLVVQWEHPRPRSLIIDSIYYHNGRKVLRTNYVHNPDYVNNTEPLLFIEGIGPTWGPFYIGFGFRVSLTCYYKDGEPQYHGPEYNQNRETPCITRNTTFWGIPKEPYKNSSYDIYPNPTQGVFEIEFPMVSSYRIVISTIAGCIIKDESVCGNRMQINALQNYPSGMYFITIINSSTLKQTIKIIKI